MSGQANRQHNVTAALDYLTKRVRQINTTNGWRGTGRTRAEAIALIHSEVSELLEYTRRLDQPAMSDHLPAVPGEDEELADILVRVLDYADEYDISVSDLVAALFVKLEYNESRGYRHGNKKL